MFRSFFDLQAVIKRLVARSSDIPKPFIWTADPDKIIAAVRRVPNVRFDPLAACRARAGRSRKIREVIRRDKVPGRCRPALVDVRPGSATFLIFITLK